MVWRACATAASFVVIKYHPVSSEISNICVSMSVVYIHRDILSHEGPSLASLIWVLFFRGARSKLAFRSALNRQPKTRDFFLNSSLHIVHRVDCIEKKRCTNETLFDWLRIRGEQCISIRVENKIIIDSLMNICIFHLLLSSLSHNRARINMCN